MQVNFGIVKPEGTARKTEVEWQLGQDLSHSPHQIRRSFIQTLHEGWEAIKKVETLTSSMKVHQYYQHILALGYEISEVERTLDTLQAKYRYYLLLSPL